MSTACEHSPAADPRFKDCIKCGKPIPKEWVRDIQRECILIQLASPDPETARVVNYRRLKRSGTGWVRRILSRNWTLEGDEELLDFVNYAVWRDQQRKIEGFEGMSAGQRHALSLILEAYQWWHRTEDED